MKPEQQFFITMLKDFIKRKQTVVNSDQLDWDELFRLADEQSLAGICYLQLKHSNIKPEILERFHEAFFSYIYFAVNREEAFQEVSTRFENAKIPFTPFKGWIVKESWPEKMLRSMGDIDIAIHPEDREKTDEIMKSLGYSKFVDNHAVWTYYEKDVMFEIHDHMFYEHLSNSFDYKGYFDNIWKYCHDTLDCNFHFLYLIAHLAKHITNKGVGFREFIDLVFYSEYYQDQLDWNWISSELAKIQLLTFTETCFAFIRAWFQVEPPIHCIDLNESFYEYVTNKVFDDGIFGLSNPENLSANSSKEIRHTSHGYWPGAFALTMKKLFPSYREMQLIPWYSFVDGRPWLMPVAWIYRWGYCLSHKMKYSLNILLMPYTKKKQITERSKHIQDWGL